MKTSLSHLPEGKQNEILHIIEIIREEARPEKIILFGSHARGTWVEDAFMEDGIHYTYISDYDFLVVIKKEDHKESQIISTIQNRCRRYHNDVMPIIHDIDYVNEGLRIGQYLFTDIIAEGILLYDTGNFDVVEPAELTCQEEKERAQEYFDIWYPQGIGFLDGAKFHLSQQQLKVGTFSLHQATESFYCAALLVNTGYKPKTHNLENLRTYAKHISEELHLLFLVPEDDEHEKRLFDLLKRGYIDARYKKNYVITAQELSELIAKVTQMQTIVKTICEAKISSLD